MSLVGVRGITSFTALGYFLTEDDQDLDDGVIAQLREAAGLAGVLLTVNGVEDQPSDSQVPSDPNAASVRTVKVVGDLADGQVPVYNADLDAFVPADPGGVWE